MPEKFTIYYVPGSPPSRACIHLARLLNLEVELKLVNLFGGDLKTDWFKKLNPVSKIPVVVYGDTVLTESRAILAYLVNKIQPGSSLYPNDPEKRALIDQRLYFDATMIFSGIIGITKSVFMNRGKEFVEAAKEEVLHALQLLNGFLEKSEYVAGDELTIADLSILANIVTIEAVGVDLTAYPNINAWYKKLHNLKGFDENKKGAQSLAKIVVKMGGPIFTGSSAKL